MPIRNAVMAAMLVLLLAACSSEGARRAAYEAAYQKGCLDRGAQANCDPQHPSYDEYRKQHQDRQQAEPAGH